MELNLYSLFKNIKTERFSWQSIRIIIQIREHFMIQVYILSRDRFHTNSPCFQSRYSVKDVIHYSARFRRPVSG